MLAVQRTDRLDKNGALQGVLSLSRSLRDLVWRRGSWLVYVVPADSQEFCRVKRGRVEMQDDLASSLLSILRTGCVESLDQTKLRELLQDLDFCRSPLPVDTIRSRYKHGVKCMACVPITLTANAPDSRAPASRRVIGIMTIGSCKLYGVTERHASLAQRVADAMAPNFVEATSDMYNNITDYVLGPMQGHSAPQSSTPRPVPQPVPSPVSNFQNFSSDDEDDDTSPSAAAQRIPSASRSQSGASSSLDSQPPPAASNHAVQTQTEVLPQGVEGQPSIAQSSSVPNSSSVKPLPINSSDQQATADTSDAAQQSTTDQSASSDTQTSGVQEQSPQDDQAQHCWQAYASSENRITSLLAAPVLLGQAAKILMQRPFSPSELPTSARHLLTEDGIRRRHTQDSQQTLRTDSSGSSQQDGYSDANCVHGKLDGKLQDGKGQDGKHVDGKHVDGKHADGKHEDGKHEDGKHEDGKHEDGKHEDGKHEDGKHVAGKHMDGKHMDGKHVAGKRQKGAATTHKQHRFLLTFKNPRIEAEYCFWQARHRTKVQLCYAMAIIAVTMCMTFVTPIADRNSLLWCSPLLQLLPVCAMAFNQSWYCRHSESMYVMLNVLKTMWALSMGIPRQGEFWNSRRRLAVVWKFSMNNLVLSGLGDLARFTIFMPVQALDLAIVTASSGMLCKQPEPSQAVPWQCVVLTIVSHVFVAYFSTGAVVWYMDKQARHKFVLQRQLISDPASVHPI